MTAHVPTEASRLRVQELAEVFTEAEIARRLGISDRTLRKHYRAELDHAMEATASAVAANLKQFAMGLKGTEKAQVTAAIFYLKVRCGWRETINVADVTDPNAGARERLAAKLGVQPPPGGAQSETGGGDPGGDA